MQVNIKDPSFKDQRPVLGASERIRGFGQECQEAGVSGQRTSQKKGAQKGVEEEVGECGERCR